MLVGSARDHVPAAIPARDLARGQLPLVLKVVVRLVVEFIQSSSRTAAIAREKHHTKPVPMALLSRIDGHSPRR